MGKAEKGVMEFRILDTPPVDREFRELEKRVREELFAVCAISPAEYVKLLLEKADERLRAERRRRRWLSRAWARLSTRNR